MYIATCNFKLGYCFLLGLFDLYKTAESSQESRGMGSGCPKIQTHKRSALMLKGFACMPTSTQSTLHAMHCCCVFCFVSEGFWVYVHLNHSTQQAAGIINVHNTEFVTSGCILGKCFISSPISCESNSRLWHYHHHARLAECLVVRFRYISCTLLHTPC